jgi:hypothetical protein
VAISRSDLRPNRCFRDRPPSFPRVPPRYDGRTLGFFEGQPGLEVGRTPEDSIAFARVSRPGTDGPALTFEAHEFSATAATAEDPLVLGRVTIALGETDSPVDYVDLQISAVLGPPIEAPLALTCLHLPVSPAAWLQAEWPPLTQQPWRGPPQRVELSLRAESDTDRGWRLATARLIFPSGNELPAVHAVLGLRIQPSAAAIDRLFPGQREMPVERLRSRPDLQPPGRRYPSV